MNWRDRIIVDPGVLVGKPIIKGTRISVEFVIDLLARGWSVEQVLKEFNHLEIEDIQSCLAYEEKRLNDENSSKGDTLNQEVENGQDLLLVF